MSKKLKKNKNQQQQQQQQHQQQQQQHQQQQQQQKTEDVDTTVYSVVDTVGQNLSRMKQDRRWRMEISQLQNRKLDIPPGYAEAARQLPSRHEKQADLVSKRGWDVALAPLKQLPMSLFIFWMAGNDLSLFPLMMVGMMFFKTLQSLLSLQGSFQYITGDQAILQKFVFLLGHVACLAVAAYKFHVMGVLPRFESDWLAFVPSPRRTEFSDGGLEL